MLNGLSKTHTHREKDSLIKMSVLHLAGLICRDRNNFQSQNLLGQSILERMAAAIRARITDVTSVRLRSATFFF